MAFLLQHYRAIRTMPECPIVASEEDLKIPGGHHYTSPHNWYRLTGICLGGFWYGIQDSNL